MAMLLSSEAPTREMACASVVTGVVARKKAEFDYMLSYSPYDQLAPKAYPPILVKTSFDDSQVMYWEPAKYVAKLRALKTDSNPLVFKTNMAGGHGGSSGRYDRIKETAFDYAFLFKVLGVRP